MKKCDFLHFGSTREILASGRQVFQQQQQRLGQNEACLSINNQFADHVAAPTAEAWIEGCRVHDQLVLHDQSVLVGVDVDSPLELGSHTCLDMLPGRDRIDRPIHFVRCYHDDDPLHNTPADQVRLCGEPLEWWLAASGLDGDGIWAGSLPGAQRSVWNARLFPAVECHEDYRQWLWMLCPTEASTEQLRQWMEADRYSFEEMATLADVTLFHARRIEARARDIRRNLRRYFRGDSGFSAGDLAYLVEHSSQPGEWLAALIGEARWHAEHTQRDEPQQAFTFSRVIHAVGSIVAVVAAGAAARLQMDDLQKARSSKYPKEEVKARNTQARMKFEVRIP